VLAGGGEVAVMAVGQLDGEGALSKRALGLEGEADFAEHFAGNAGDA